MAVQTEYELSSAEISQGFVYSCCRSPISNLLLDAEDLSEYAIPNTQILPAKIDSLHLVNEDLLKVSLRLPPGKSFHFLPGQYINVMHGAIKRSYSLANINAPNQNLELLIRRYDGGAMSAYWFHVAKINDLLRIEGPLGTFFIRNSESHTLVLLATGTGIAPIKSMLESEVYTAYSFKRIVLIWGMRNTKDLCWTPSDALLKNIEFIPVMSKDSEWKGEKGHVQDIAMKLNIDFTSCDIYACGNQSMIQEAKKIVMENGLEEHHFYADSFLPSS